MERPTGSDSASLLPRVGLSGSLAADARVFLGTPATVHRSLTGLMHVSPILTRGRETYDCFVRWPRHASWGCLGPPNEGGSMIGERRGLHPAIGHVDIVPWMRLWQPMWLEQSGHWQLKAPGRTLAYAETRRLTGPPRTLLVSTSTAP